MARRSRNAVVGIRNPHLSSQVSCVDFISREKPRRRAIRSTSCYTLSATAVRPRGSQAIPSAWSYYALTHLVRSATTHPARRSPWESRARVTDPRANTRFILPFRITSLGDPPARSGQSFDFFIASVCVTALRTWISSSLPTPGEHSCSWKICSASLNLKSEANWAA